LRDDPARRDCVHVTVTRTKGPPGQPLDVATIAGEEMLPWLREIDGFDGLLMLSNEAEATTLVLTFWQDREVAERHRAARARFREGVTTAVQVTVEELKEYEVAFADLGPRLTALGR
jgi:heme-degrading monooxygenase HmoA